jgi:hypothetical protein
MPAYSSARLLLGAAVLATAGLGLGAGAAQALTTPCSFPDPTPSPVCTSGPYQSTPSGDKVISDLVAPNAGIGEVDFTEEVGVGGGKSYRVSFDFNPPLTTPPGPISGTSQYQISIDQLNPYYFKIASLSWSGTGSPTVTKEIYSAPFTPSSLLATISVDGGSYAFSQNYKNIWIRDTYGVPNDSVSNLDNFQNTFTQGTADVPGPLPLFGAGMAFSLSRRLRRRSSQRVILG